MGVKFISSNGQGSTDGAIKAINYAVKNGAKVLSNSWGAQMPMGGDASLLKAIEQAKDAGVLFIAAAGNHGGDNDSGQPVYPASYDLDNIVAVAATDRNDGLASFSGRGLKSVDLGAPGVDVYSTVPGDKYMTHSGTSMATPHVAGAAAMIWAANPDFTYQQVRDTLMSSVDQVPSLKGKTVTGGRLNLKKALKSTE